MDTAQFAARIDDLLARQDQGARPWASAGCARVTRDFDFSTYIGNLENLFERVAAPKTREPELALPNMQRVRSSLIIGIAGRQRLGQILARALSPARTRGHAAPSSRRTGITRIAAGIEPRARPRTEFRPSATPSTRALLVAPPRRPAPGRSRRNAALRLPHALARGCPRDRSRPRRVLVLEGILVLHHAASARRLDHAVFVETARPMCG